MRIAIALLVLTVAPTALSNEKLPLLTQPIVYDHTNLYEEVSPKVFKVFVDKGYGSGFLIDGRGLVATNHHVIANTRFLAVQVSEDLVVPAEIIVSSARYDLGIIKIGERHVNGVEPLSFLSKEEEDAFREGTPVVAFGSPLGTTSLATQGIISKIEEASMFGDFLIKSGNSGGPVVNHEGRVVGVSTYGLDDIAGAVRAGYLRKLLEDIEDDDIAMLPIDDEPLRWLPAERYPTEVLKEKIMEPWDKSALLYGTKNASLKFSVSILTPVAIGQLQTEDQLKQAENRYKRRGRKIHDESYHAVDEMFYEWHRDAAAELAMAVTVIVMPKKTETWGSILAQGIMSGISPGLTTTRSYKYRGEFYDLRIFRDGEEIEPVYPGRVLEEMDVKVPMITFMDEAYAGMYRYHPEDFMKGSKFEFNIYEARNPEKPHNTKVFLSGDDTIRKIRSDFEGVLKQ